MHVVLSRRVALERKRSIIVELARQPSAGLYVGLCVCVCPVHFVAIAERPREHSVSRNVHKLMLDGLYLIRPATGE